MIRALLLSLLLPTLLHAGEVRLAVASNVYSAARAMAATFEHQTDHSVTIAHGATGRLYVQITRGAPFDIFLAADAARPLRLEMEGLTAGRRSYALGRLVLIGSNDLSTPGGITMAIADPALAPYGVAAQDFLARTGVGADDVNLVLAENIAQVAVWVETGNADAGILAAGLAEGLRDDIPVRPIPASLHDPILQDAVLLASAADNPAARAFWDWMETDDARAILRDHGYDIP